MYLLDVAGFLVLFALPLAPGLLEILRPRDNSSLNLNTGYSRNPRFFGDSMRAKVAPLLAEERTDFARRVPFLGRRGEYARIGEKIAIPRGKTTDEVLLAFDHLDARAGASFLDGYGIGSVKAGARARARTLLSDGDVRIGDGCTIGRWVDAGGTLSVGERCDLGRSASAQRVVLGRGTRFARVFGTPITTAGCGVASDTRETQAVEAGDIVDRESVRIADGRRIGGSVKSYGSLVIGAGAHIHGNAIARGNITIEPGARVDGHVFSEGRLAIGADVCIGTAGSNRTAYGALAVTIASGASIFGWLVSDGRGFVA